MYIALDQSPLYLNSFQIQNMMTTSERLTHALTVHYLSAAILGAGKCRFYAMLLVMACFNSSQLKYLQVL